MTFQSGDITRKERRMDQHSGKINGTIPQCGEIKDSLTQRFVKGLFRVLSPFALVALLMMECSSESVLKKNHTQPASSPVLTVRPTSSEKVPFLDPETTAKEAAFVSEVKACESLIEWHQLKMIAAEQNLQSTDIVTAISETKVKLLSLAEIHSVTDSLDLVAFDWNLAETAGPITHATFIASWLFYKKGSVEFSPDRRVLLVLRGFATTMHKEYFENEVHREKGSFTFCWLLKPTIDEWEIGNYYLVTKRTYRPVPNIPYRLVTSFSKSKRNKDDNDWRFAGVFGEPLVLGWHVDQGD
jgi:hypothetical protein